MIANVNHINGDDPVLLPDRDEPYVLNGVYEKVTYACRDELILDFTDCFVRFGVDTDWDTITAELHRNAFVLKRGYRSLESSPPWEQYLNKPIGWTWFAVNRQGYWDSVLISFQSIVPNILLNVMASSIYVFPIGSMEKIDAGVLEKPASNRRRAPQRN